MPDWPPLHLIGITYRQAGLSVRERFARPRAEIAALLSGHNGSRRQGVILSTCNRFEIYWWEEPSWEAWFRDAAASLGLQVSPTALVRKSGQPAARHLFRVAAGLDSQVVGEREVLGQVRGAWEIAREARSTTPELNLVFAAAVAAGRRVRRETFLGEHPPSIGSVAVDFGRAELGGSLGDREILVLGAGAAARGVVAAINGAVGGLRIASRRSDHAARLAARSGGLPLSWERLDGALQSADLVFTATAAPLAVLSAARLADVLQRRSVPLVLIDLGVPRNVEPAARALPGLRLLDLDDLRARDGLERLAVSGALEAARDLIDEEASRLLERLRVRSASDRIAELHRLGAVLAEEEAAVTLDRLPSLKDDERQQVRRMADRLVRRVLFPASRVLRASVATRGVNGGSTGPAASSSEP